MQWTDFSVKFPEDIRLDGWVQDGTEVTPFYDPLLAKILAHGKDRDEAIQKLQTALSQTEIHGIETNIEYLNDWVEKHWSRMEPIHTRSLETFTFFPGPLRSSGPEPRLRFRTIPEDSDTGMLVFLLPDRWTTYRFGLAIYWWAMKRERQGSKSLVWDHA